VRGERFGLNPEHCLSYWRDLSAGRGEWNSWCSGEMRRYQEEHPWRRQLAGHVTDAEARKRGEQTGLDTLVVHALNDGY
jgi:hypothetical protein